VKSVWRDGTGAWRTTLRGRPILADPRINKGTAFSEAERDALGITGLIPPARMTLAEQAARILTQYHRQSTDLGKNVLLTELRDRNQVLYYHVLTQHLREMLPIVYTPTVGQAIQQFSQEYRRPRGVYLSVHVLEGRAVAAGPRPRRRGGPDRGHRRGRDPASATGASAACTSRWALAVYTAAGGTTRSAPCR
jgi:malate dehydrogenase (oxaloacetate-decarboxylating)